VGSSPIIKIISKDNTSAYVDNQRNYNPLPTILLTNIARALKKA